MRLIAAKWRPVDEHMLLIYPCQSFLDRLSWNGDVVTGWRQFPDPKSTVLLRPDIRFGRPAVA